ncbi:MAG TPA: hydrogenase maturation nickel metallochaperone HypA [Coriobacteriia bacterium]
MGITAEVLNAVFKAAEEAGAVRVNTVHLTVGELTEVVPDSLQFAWEALTPGTIAEGAELLIEETPGRSRCLDCGTVFEHDRFERLCTGCGSFLVEVLSGHELMIGAVDVGLPGADETPAAGDEQGRSEG